MTPESITDMTAPTCARHRHRGIYYDDGGHAMLGSTLVRDPKFQDRVVAETRALPSTIPMKEER